MRFLLRSFIGLALIAGAVALVVYSWSEVATLMAEKRGASGGRAAEERVFAVEVGVVRNGDASPVIEAYGEIRSWRTLELRATAGGRLVELTDRFRDGADVEAGDLLFRIDQKTFSARLEDAIAGLEEAEADLAEARQAVEVARREGEAAETQRDLRAAGLNRRVGLLNRGVATAAEVEEAEMALAAADQAAAGRAQAILAATIKIERTALRLRRAEIAVSDARRDLTDTDHRADFGGLLSDVTASLGALVSPNERLGLLIDPTALEAVFRVTNAQYARLLDDRGALRPIRLVVTLDLDDRPLRLPGVIERASAVIGEGETGRQIYARLELEAGSVLRPGDFVAVEIEEPALTDVATLPAAAVTEAGQLLVLDETDRLRSADVRILRRQGDEVIVADAPEGVRYVASRAPQLGAGVKVRPLGEVEEGQDLVDLAPDRQKRLIGFVERSDQMSSEMKVRMLSTLRSGRAPADMVDRIERRMGSAG